MVSVVAQTEPAKFIATLSACHVHAALVFFDVGFALGTWFGIQFNPD